MAARSGGGRMSASPSGGEPATQPKLVLPSGTRMARSKVPSSVTLLPMLL